MFRFDFLGTGSHNDTYTLVTWDNTTTFSPTDFAYTNLAAGKSGTFNISGNSLEFTVVPEPRALILLSLGAIPLIRRRRSPCPAPR